MFEINQTMRSNNDNSELQRLMKENEILKNKMQHYTVNYIINQPNNEQNVDSAMRNEINELKEMVQLLINNTPINLTVNRTKKHCTYCGLNNHEESQYYKKLNKDKVCTFCGLKFHTEDICYKKRNQYKIKSQPKNYNENNIKCYICKSTYHYPAMCPISKELETLDQSAEIDQIKINPRPDKNENNITVNTCYANNNQKLCLEGIIDSKKITLVFDTGAPITIIRKDLINTSDVLPKRTTLTLGHPRLTPRHRHPRTALHADTMEFGQKNCINHSLTNDLSN